MRTIPSILLATLVVLGAGQAWAAGEDVALDHIETDMNDKPSLQRGAQLFFENCIGCHSLEYGRYNRVAQDLGIPEDLFEQYLLDGDYAIGDLMTSAMSEDQGRQFFGAAPPDLTNVARVRGPDWIYTFLKSFYEDPTRPYGVNNAVFSNTGMPHVLYNLQGLCAEAPDHGDCAEYVSMGSMAPDEYDQVAYDLANFLEYMGEPIQATRERMGWFVLAFLSVLLVFAWLLYRELWKDVR